MSWTPTIRIRRSISSTALAMFLCGCLVSPVLLAAPADLLVVFDKSSSMNQAGKLAQAQSGLKEALSTLPAGTNVGLEVFSGCDDAHIETPIPVGPLNRSTMTAQVDAIRAGGNTALEKALRTAASTLGAGGKKSVLLLSDGEETCNGDPCAAIKSIVANGTSLVAYVVGFKVNASAEAQLRCISESTGGSYYQAENAEQLEEALKEITQEAARTGIQGYTRCAHENGTCNFTGTRSVAYGANGKFAYKTATNGIACNNATFGDPIYGTVKACYYK